jgi:hypothetical protein
MLLLFEARMGRSTRSRRGGVVVVDGFLVDVRGISVEVIDSEIQAAI